MMTLKMAFRLDGTLPALSENLRVEKMDATSTAVPSHRIKCFRKSDRLCFRDSKARASFEELAILGE